MKKPDSLRRAIEAAIPALKRDGERMLIFIDKGNVRSHMTADFSFEYRYTLNVLIEDYAGDVRILTAAILAWAREQQPDLVTPKNEAFSFDADILDNKTADFAIEIQLTENVRTVRRDDGGFDMEYIDEPGDDVAEIVGGGIHADGPPLSQIWLDSGEKILPDEPPLGADVQPAPE